MKWREDAQNLTLLMDYLRLLQPPGALLKTLRGKEQLGLHTELLRMLHLCSRSHARACQRGGSLGKRRGQGVDSRVQGVHCSRIHSTRLRAVSFVRILNTDPPSRTQKQLKEKEEEGDLGERAMRSVIAAAVSLLCAKDDGENEEEKAEITRERDDNPETKFGQRLGDIANIVLPKVIELLTQDQHERFSRKRIIRTPETKVCDLLDSCANLLHTNHSFPLTQAVFLPTGQAPVARRQPHRALPGMLVSEETGQTSLFSFPCPHSSAHRRTMKSFLRCCSCG